MSAGEEVGDYGRIFVDGMDVALGERGYNLIAVNPEGDLLERVVFDTLCRSRQRYGADCLAGTWPNGTVIAGAVNDEASLNLNQDAVNALGTGSGVATDLRGEVPLEPCLCGCGRGLYPATAGKRALLAPRHGFVGMPVDAAQKSAQWWAQSTLRPVDPAAAQE